MGKRIKTGTLLVCVDSWEGQMSREYFCVDEQEVKNRIFITCLDGFRYRVNIYRKGVA